MENINDIKNKIRQLIYQKNVLAHKFSFYNDDRRHQEALESCKFDAFRISRDEFRTVDKIRVIDGKKTWLYKIVVDEMIESGELIECKSYCASPNNPYAKAYPLTWEKFMEIRDSINVVSPKKEKQLNEWKPEDGFITDEGFERSSKNGIVSTECYTEKEIKRLEKECSQAVSYHNKIKEITLEKQLDSINNEWITKSDRWQHNFTKAVLQYNKQTKNGNNAIPTDEQLEWSSK